MAQSFAASRAQLVYALCLPVAVLVGYFLAEPIGLGNLAMLGMIFGILCIPLLMRQYHPLLIFGWNAAIQPFFLPGQPMLWMLLALAGYLFALLNRFTTPEARFENVPAITRSLVFLLGVVLLTGYLRGGLLGFRAFGSSVHGAKGYFMIFAAIAGYFALTSQRIPARRASLCVAGFFLSSLTGLIPNLAYAAGPKFEFLFYLFPAANALEQLQADYRMDMEIVRIYGLTSAATGLLYWGLARYGLRGLFAGAKPWRLPLMAVAAGGVLLSGFRSVFLLVILTFFILLLIEGLPRRRILAAAAGLGIVAGALLLPNIQHLPLVAQRTLSFLPVRIDPVARISAEDSSRWRLEMWRDVVPEIPRYLFRGRGYAINPTDLAFTSENLRRGYGQQYAWAIETGAFHNGPLSVIVLFGIWGVIGFGWFVAASIRYLYRQQRDGEAPLATINRFLLAAFLARVVCFCVIFGDLGQELFIYTGLIGLSVSLNGGLKPKRAPAPEAAGAQAVLDPALARRD